MPNTTQEHSPEKIPRIVMSFAASDPSGGAGLQADIMTLSSLGCHPLSIVTAITVQDSSGVEDILVLDADWVADQARILLEDMPVAAFKIGMLGSVEIIAAIAEIVSDYPDIPLILDPVLASGRGDELANEEMIAALRELLLPQASIITPNSLEALRLAATGENEEVPLAECAHRLVTAGSEFVLITGTHENTPQVTNTLYGVQGVLRADNWERLPGNYHGSGCTLASAIAAHLAHNCDMIQAVCNAQDYTWRTLSAGLRLGMGQFLPNRFFWVKDNTHGWLD